LTCFDDDGRVELRAWPEQRLERVFCKFDFHSTTPPSFIHHPAVSLGRLLASVHAMRASSRSDTLHVQLALALRKESAEHDIIDVYGFLSYYALATQCLEVLVA
jgi:hypothetical protein